MEAKTTKLSLATLSVKPRTISATTLRSQATRIGCFLSCLRSPRSSRTPIASSYRKRQIQGQESIFSRMEYGTLAASSGWISLRIMCFSRPLTTTSTMHGSIPAPTSPRTQRLRKKRSSPSLAKKILQLLFFNYVLVNLLSRVMTRVVSI